MSKHQHDFIKKIIKQGKDHLTVFSPQNKRKISLQRYWTTRYVITLTIGLVAVAILSAWWIRHTTFENRMNMMLLMAEETANQIVYGRGGVDEDRLLSEFEVRQFLEEPGRYLQMQSDPSVFLVNTNGEVIYSNTQNQGLHQQLNPSILYTDQDMEKFYAENYNDTVYIVKKPIKTGQILLGWVVFLEFKENLTAVDQEYKQLFIMIGALALLGWLAIFFLTRRLAKPISEVSIAAEKVKTGDYDITLPDNVQAKEVHELIQSFKEMAGKLEQLESLRTELLAGVTHELKTPVTSVSGLLQALRDGVVEGDEAEEFLQISLKETAKMKTMIEDLLAFNSFVAKAVPLSMLEYNVNGIVEEMIHEWEVTLQEPVAITIDPLKEDVTVEVDIVRLQQIIVNLFNNALHAMSTVNEKRLHLNLAVHGETVTIDVEDNGIGIPQSEQGFIFERFYRGDQKKFQMSGFGLGLPFSKMIAQALGGDLILLSSSSDGTTFQIRLPISKGNDI